MATAQHVEHLIFTRTRMARRWFGLRNDDEIRDFVLADPDVRTLRGDRAMRDQIAFHLVCRIERALASGDHATLRDLRAQLGEAYDDIVALLEAAHAR